MHDAAYAERDKTIATVFLNRPKRLNALDLTMAALLVRHFQELVHDDTISSIVITGRGRAQRPRPMHGRRPLDDLLEVGIRYFGKPCRRPGALRTRQAGSGTREAAMSAGAIESKQIRALSGDGVPGVAVLVAGPEGVRAAGAAGLADLAGQVPAALDVVCPWFSMTKIVTATAAMQLAERGVFDLDASVPGHLPTQTSSCTASSPRTAGFGSSPAHGRATPTLARWSWRPPWPLS